MAKAQGEVKKIYRLEVAGFDTVKQNLQFFSDQLAKIKKQIIDLRGQSLGLKGDDLAKVNQQIVAAGKAQDDLVKKVEKLNAENQTSVSTYFKLNQAYTLAKKNAQDLAVAHGVESKEAIAAAETAAAYKNQLIEINNLVKTGGRPLAPVVPIASPIVSTTNVGGLNEEEISKTGDTLSELEKQQADVANSAFAMGQAQHEAAEEIKVAGTEISAIQTKYEQYTGTIRQNITAQIENNQQLLANRASQKEIQAAINGQGFATDAQIQKMAALKEEEQILVETNKSLTLTIRNQTKEFIAASGSLDEMQAQLNQLQQAYEQLTEQEKASPFGQEMKKEIDILEPKVKSLEAELGKFSRNVGNYPQIFGGAFKVLNTELDNVKGKLVKGNFGTKELADLTAKEQVLTNATKVLGQTFATTAQQQAAFKEQGRQLAIAFGTDSDVYKNFAKEVAAGNNALKQSDQQLVKATASGGKFSGALSNVYGGIRKLANIIPGLGLSGVVLLLLAPLESFASSLGNIFTNVGKKSKEAGSELESLKKQVELANDAVEKSSDEFIKAFTNVETLRINVGLAKQGFIDKKKVVDEYNKSMGETTGQVQTLDEVEKKLVEAGPAYIQMMLLKAAAQKAVQAAAEETFKSTLQLQKDLATVTELNKKGQAERDKAAGAAGASEFLSSGLKNEAAAAKANSERRILTLKTIAEKFQKDAAEISKQFGFNFFDAPKDGKGPKEKDTAFQDALRDIDTFKSLSLAIENKRVNEIQKIRTLSFDEEIFHLKELERINIEALNKKIALFDTKKKLTSDEKKDRAEFGEQITSIELSTSQKINDIEKKRFDQRVKTLQDQLDSELTQIQLAKQAIVDNVESTELEKAQAQLDADNKELEARKKFFDALLLLNDQFNKEAIVKAKDSISKIQQATEADRKKLIAATLQDIKAAGDKEIAAQDIKFEVLRNKILTNDQLTASKRKKQLDDLGKAHERTILAIELKTLQAQFEITKNLFALGLISEQAFLDAQKKFVEKANQLQANITGTAEKLKTTFTNLKDVIQNGIRNAFKIDKGSPEDQALGEIIAQSYQFATDVMHDYFDAEQQRIQENLELQLKRLDIEEEQVKSRAQSTAEIESIEKQFAAKRRAEERKAHEEMKKSKRSEAKIAFAIEVANIWAAAASYPFPANLIIGGVMTALAAARLALTISQINRETFQRGGVPTKTGGPITGPSHAGGGVPFNYEAEGGELAIINKRSVGDNKVRTITGTNKQIASMINEIGGGVSFAKGAKTHYFEGGGYLGTNLQAPVFTPANNFISMSGGLTKDDLTELTDSMKAIAKEQSARVDRLEVVQVTNSVTTAQKKVKQYSDVGTL